MNFKIIDKYFFIQAFKEEIRVHYKRYKCISHKPNT